MAAGTDGNGEAVVELPEYFDALNKDFRYQLTVIGTFAQAIIAEKIKGNRFRIKTSASNVEVSWQVTGVRHDAFANKNRIRVEEEKPEIERGYYLHPLAFGLEEDRGIDWARDPEGMQQLSSGGLKPSRDGTSNPINASSRANSRQGRPKDRSEEIMNTKRVFPIVVVTMFCLGAMTHQAQAQLTVIGTFFRCPRGNGL